MHSICAGVVIHVVEPVRCHYGWDRASRCTQTNEGWATSPVTSPPQSPPDGLSAITRPVANSPLQPSNVPRMPSILDGDEEDDEGEGDRRNREDAAMRSQGKVDRGEGRRRVRASPCARLSWKR